MKNTLIYSLVLFCLSNIYSQKFDGYIVTTSNDTIKCKYFVETNIFDETMFYANSVRKSVKILNEKGEKFKLKPSQLISFVIKGTQFGDFKFKSFKEDNYQYFYHEIIVGKISLLRLYQENLYSGGANSGYRDFIYKENKLSKITNFNYRKDFGLLIQDYPILFQKWMDSNKYYKTDQIEEVIMLYNEYFKK